MFRDLFGETIWSLAGNKARSGLTILGIVIGIASVITMMAIGQGAQQSIAASIQSIGSNLLIVMPGAERSGGVSQGAGSRETLTLEDAKAISESVPGIAGVAPEDSGRYQITAKGMNTNTQVIGTLPAYTAVRNVSLNSGSFFTQGHVTSSAKVAVLGSSVRDDLFGEGVDPTGQDIRIKGIAFRVIGVAASKGGSGFNNPDDSVYIPITSMQHFLSGNAFVTSVNIAAESEAVMTSVQDSVTQLLLMRHKISNASSADFRIMNQADIVQTASSVTQTFTILLSSIAGISLLVGGIGIMNMMLATVTERTREIGLRKAVGIRKRHISLQFLAEALVLTFLGGVMGILLGWLASLGLSSVFGLTTTISLSSIVLAVGVSAAVGIIFGFYPAWRASNLRPIEALRYE